MIKWIFFDVGSTLVDETEAYDHRAREMIKNTDITFSEFDNKRIELAKLMSNITVKISGLSFEQLNGDISVQLVFDYANNEYDFATDEIVFACGDMIADADTAATNAFTAYMSK